MLKMDSLTQSNQAINFLHSHESNHLQIFIKTERLLIYSYDKTRDFENSVKLYGDPQITKYYDAGQVRSRDEVAQLVANYAVNYFEKDEPFGLFSVFTKEDHSFIGHLDFRPTPIPGTAEIGYILHKVFHGKGFGIEAVNSMIKGFAAEIIKRGYQILNSPIRSIRAAVHQDNKASIKLLEKVGMTFKESFGLDSPGLWYSMDV